jgi:nitroreductase
MAELKFLKSTSFVDSDAEVVVRFAKKLLKASKKKKPVRLCSTMWSALDYLNPAVYRASEVLKAGRGFCVGKAALLAACARDRNSSMVIDVYAAMANGVWLNEPYQYSLLRKLRADIRTQTGLQDFVGVAPLNLVYVAHGERMQDVSPQERRLYASVDTGFIGQNVYLFCASEGLATVFRGAVNYKEIDRIMQLGTDQFVTFAQTVGYPRN